MASSISALSNLNASALQSLTPPASQTEAAAAGAGATQEVQALQKQGDFNTFLNDSMAAALLNPTNGINSGTPATTLVNNMLQQVLGAYQAQSR